jgi:hypothetical protein
VALTKLPSYQSVRRLFRRHALRQFVSLLLLLLCAAVFSAHILFFASWLLALSPLAVNGVFTSLCLGLVGILIQSIRAWRREGFRLHAFYRRWENQHPELADRASLIVYSQTKQDEVSRLGYSQELISAEDQWVQDYITKTLKQERGFVPLAWVLLFLAMAVPTGLFLAKNQDLVYTQYFTIQDALWTRGTTGGTASIQVVSLTKALRGEALDLRAAVPDGLETDRAAVHLLTASGWQTFPAEHHGEHLTYRIPALYQRVDYYFSSGGALSNRGQVLPLDPPSITKGQVTITPMPYTGKPVETVPLRPFSVPAGSRVQLQAEATSVLREAQVIYQEVVLPVHLEGAGLQTSFQAMQSGELILAMTDEYGFAGQRMSYPVTVIEDTTPVIDILSPEPVSQVPDSLMQQVQIHVRDDYHVQRVLVYTRVNDKPETDRVGLIWAFTPEAAAEVNGATDFYLSYDWDLTQFNLFPGDTMTFSLEAWDNDAIHGVKKGRTEDYIIQFPTLVDLLKNLDVQEQEQLNQMNTLLEEQKAINQDVKDTLEQLSEKLESHTDEATEDQLWFEEQELKAIQERQEKLIEEAKRIEEALQQYEQAVEETLNKEETAEPGFTPETLEKIERIRELMNELVDQDGQQLMQKLENTIEQMTQQMDPQALEQLQFSFQEYESQLDQTLSMLEKTFESRQLDGIRQMAEDLARRQDHLQRETEELAQAQEQLKQETQASQDAAEGQDQTSELQKKAEDLAQKQKQLEERQKGLEEETQAFQQKVQDMQKQMQEQNPMVSEMLKQMMQQMTEQGLNQKMNQASQSIAQSDFQQAQQNQQSAQEMLKAMAGQLQQQMANMGMMNMQQSSDGIQRLIDRSLFLSHKMESLTESVVGQGSDSYALQQARAFLLELQRVALEWQTATQSNPFLGRDVHSALQRSQERLAYGIRAGQGAKWVGLHEARQSLIALNQAIYLMLQNMQTMQQQMQQMAMQQFGQQMQQLMSQQQSLGEMLEQMKQMGQEPSPEALAQLQQMAQQQAQIRKELEKMMKQYRQAQQLRNQLDGIYQEMKEVEDLLQQGVNDERVDERQKRILSRMLEAGTFQEKDEFGDEREAEVAKTGKQGAQPIPDVPLELKDKVQRTIQRPDDEMIPLQYREAIKNHFIRLSEQMVN